MGTAELSNGLALNRDVIGALNIGLKHLSPDESLMALGLIKPHEVWVKLMNPHQELTPLKNTASGETPKP